MPQGRAHHDDLGPIVVMAEVIFTAPPGRRGMDPDAASWAALQRYGFGQDFVLHVPMLVEAVRYALDALAREPDSRWEGTGVLVAGTRDATLAAASVIVDDGRPQG